MGCGKEHSISCDAVLADLYAYLDGETTQQQLDRIAQHLRECPPCLDEHEVEAALKAVIRRSCACEPAPPALRARIIARITTVHVQLEG